MYKSHSLKSIPKSVRKVYPTHATNPSIIICLCHSTSPGHSSSTHVLYSLIRYSILTSTLTHSHTPRLQGIATMTADEADVSTLASERHAVEANTLADASSDTEIPTFSDEYRAAEETT